jgi:hypothetical protein
MPSKPLKAIKPMFQKGKWRILRGDLVQIIAGKDKGLTGRVLRVIRDTRFPRVIVEGRNMVGCVIIIIMGLHGAVGHLAAAPCSHARRSVDRNRPSLHHPHIHRSRSTSDRRARPGLPFPWR